MKTVDKVIVSFSIIVFVLTQVISNMYNSIRGVVITMNFFGWFALILLTATVIQLVCDTYENRTMHSDEE